MRVRTKVAIAAVLLATVVAPPVALVPEYGVAPEGYTGTFWIGTSPPYDINEELFNIGRGARWEQLEPIPGPNPPIEALWQPSIETLLEAIRDPRNVYMACATHG